MWKWQNETGGQMFKVEIPPLNINWNDKLIRDAVTDAVKIGMFRVEITSKKDYLSGPRPGTLGVVTGRLRNSIRSDVITDRNTLRGEVGTSVIYGKIHEEGLGRFPKRSFLSTAIEDEIKEIESDVIKAIENNLGKAIT